MDGGQPNLLLFPRGGLGLTWKAAMPPDALRNEIHKVGRGWDGQASVNVMPMSPFVKEVMQVVLEERVPVITTARESRRVCAAIPQGDWFKGHSCGCVGHLTPCLVRVRAWTP